ncbi:MAG: ATP-binding protein [Sandaracinaceae bacterium]
MSLRWRITVAVVLVAMLPSGVLGYLLRELTLEQTRSEYQQRLEATTDSARRRVSERRHRERRALARLCEGDFLVDRLLLDLQVDRFGPIEQGELVEQLPNVMRSLGLAALLVVDGRGAGHYGRVFAAGHFPGRADADESELAHAIERAGDRWLVRSIPTRADGATHDMDALLTGCVAEQGEARVIVVGGQVLDDSFVDTLAADVPPVHLLLTDAEGRVPEGQAFGGGRRDVHTFEGIDGQPAARLIAVVDDGPLQRRIEQLDRRLLVTMATALVGAVLLGLLLAMGITGPLRELESAAVRVASGEMGTTITVRSGGEVGKALSAFNHMTKELKHAQAKLIRAERIAAWRDIARRIAHEIKNPLMPIQTSIETMRKTHARRHPDFDEIFEESTVTILEEVERLKHIVSEFSSFARMPRPNPVVLDVREVAAHVVGLHSGADVHVALTVEGSPMKVRCDREQMTQVLVNLVQNGADAARARHGASGGRVDVILSEADDGVRIEVIDNGPGVPPEERERIFEPYYTTKSTGTGLGLAIVHRIISDHAGSIDVDEGADGGAVFEIVLSKKGPPEEASTTQTDTALPLTTRRS